MNLEDLLLIGFSEATFHSMDVKGNVEAFEASNSWLKKDFAANYRGSVFANGNLSRKFFVNGLAVFDSKINDEYKTYDQSLFRLQMSVESTEPIWDSWRFTGKGVYDPQHQWDFGNLDMRLLTYPQEPARLELLARMESKEHGYIEGGSLRSSFQNSELTMKSRSLFGGFADLHKGRAGVELVGGKLEGRHTQAGSVIGIRADGTSGPFDLEQAPVIRGSESITIESRDRFDETTVLASRNLTRDIDYNIDYLRGRIILHQPVTSEDISQNPNFIVIAYDYRQEDNDDVIGGRARYMTDSSGSVGISILHRFRDKNFAAVSDNEPQNIPAADVSLNFKDFGSGYLEIAGSDNFDDDRDYMALRAGVNGRIDDRFGINASILKIEDQYKSLTNSYINPNKNQQRIEFNPSYDLNEHHKLFGRFRNIRGLTENGEFNTYNGLREENVYGVGYGGRYNHSYRYGLEFERRDVKDRLDATHEDNHQNRLIADAWHGHDHFGFLGKFGYGLHYEFTDFNNDLDSGFSDSRTNQAALIVSSAPNDDIAIEITQKINVRKDEKLDLYDRREDATFASVRMRPYYNLNSLTTIEYKRYTAPGGGINLWQKDPLQFEKSGTFALEYLPLRKIKALGKLGRYDMQNLVGADTRRTDDFLFGQITYYPKHHLGISGESELRRIVNESEVNTRSKVWDLGMRLNWNRDRFTDFTVGLIRRWQLEREYARPDARSVSYIFLLSGSMYFGKGFYFHGAVKEHLLRDAIDDEKFFTTAEIGYEGRQGYRVAIGYERIENKTDDYSDRYYRGHGVFLRLVGKI